MKVPFSYLTQQFSNPDPILKKVKKLVQSGDFTLGKALVQFEKTFAKICQTKYAIGVNSGTDALLLSLKALGIGAGDEVITVPNTFIATVGAIVASGAKPVFVDCDEEYLIDLNLIEKAITPKTKAILPVHYAGHPVNMERLMQIAEKHQLFVVEDACQAIGATWNRRKVGSFGKTAAFSFHPLKNINVWSDAGMIVTSDEELCKKLRLLRNHGMKNRDEYEIFGINSRFDTLQAVVANHLIGDLEGVIRKRNATAKRYDEVFAKFPEHIVLPPRRKNARYVFHLYILQVQRRDELLNYLLRKGVEAKIHYPIPLHLQNCAKHLGYKAGDFPVAERQAKQILSLPIHQYLRKEQVEYVIDCVQKFYLKG